VPAGSKIRLRLKIKSVEPVDGGGTRITNESTMEIEGGTRPVLVAETIGVTYD
jgi:acyl dehydratase